MKQARFLLMAIAALTAAPLAFAQDKADDAILGSWDITYQEGGNEMTALISVARNSNGRLVGLWTQLPERERINLVEVSFADNKLTAGRPVLINESLETQKIAATIEGTKISGMLEDLKFKGMKRGSASSGGGDEEEGGREGRRRGGRNIDVGALIEQADTNGDGMLQKDEAPERMQQFFDMMDANNDGNVSKEEAEEAFKRFQGNQN